MSRFELKLQSWLIWGQWGSTEGHPHSSDCRPGVTDCLHFPKGSKIVTRYAGSVTKENTAAASASKLKNAEVEKSAWKFWQEADNVQPKVVVQSMHKSCLQITKKLWTPSWEKCTDSGGELLQKTVLNKQYFSALRNNRITARLELEGTLKII